MARTEAPAPPTAAPTAQAAAPPTAPAAAPVLVWPQAPAQPAPGSQAADPRPRAARRERGVPVTPALTAATNALAMAGTAAYEAGGWPALAATGAVAAGSTAAAAVRRRATVKRRMASGRAGGVAPRASSGMRSSGLSRPSSAGPRGGRGSTTGSTGGGSSRRATGRGVTASWPSPSSSSSRRGSAARGGLPGNSSATRPVTRGSASAAAGKTLRAGQAGKRTTLAAAAGRAARNGAKPGSLPRRAAAAVGRTVARPFRSGSMARRAGAATGRGLKKAWVVSKPHRTTARKTTGRGLKRAAGAAWDATRALAAGARAWFRTKKGEKSGALARIREVWAKRRTDRAEKNAAKAAAVEAAKKPPEVGTAARRPTTTAIPATFTGGTAVSGHHFTASAMEMCRAAANYQPTGMMQVGQDFAGLQEAMELLAKSLQITVENADAKQPLAPQIIETMRQIHSLQLKAAELASELGPAFRKFHDVDIQRIENPRKGREGERMWDVSANL